MADKASNVPEEDEDSSTIQVKWGSLIGKIDDNPKFFSGKKNIVNLQIQVPDPNKFTIGSIDKFIEAVKVAPFESARLQIFIKASILPTGTNSLMEYFIKKLEEVAKQFSTCNEQGIPNDILARSRTVFAPAVVSSVLADVKPIVQPPITPSFTASSSGATEGLKAAITEPSITELADGVASIDITQTQAKVIKNTSTQ